MFVLCIVFPFLFTGPGHNKTVAIVRPMHEPNITTVACHQVANIQHIQVAAHMCFKTAVLDVHSAFTRKAFVQNRIFLFYVFFILT